jgi:hypothetical protein
VHFGLGAESVATQVEITWSSGIELALVQVTSNQILMIKESIGIPTERIDTGFWIDATDYLLN